MNCINSQDKGVDGCNGEVCVSFPCFNFPAQWPRRTEIGWLNVRVWSADVSKMQVAPVDTKLRIIYVHGVHSN